MAYRVGQILYIVPANKIVVYPIQVIEEVTKKTLAGSEIDYILRGSSGESINLKDVDGELFDSAAIARATLIDRATKSITKMITTAVTKAKEWYPEATESPETSVIPATTGEVQQLDDGGTEVDLGDGTIARVILPAALRG